MGSRTFGRHTSKSRRNSTALRRNLLQRSEKQKQSRNFVINTDASNARQITHSTKSEYAAKWVKNGTRIAFLSAESGSVQLWEMNPDGTKRKQITNHEGGISDFLYSPDGTKILFIADVKHGERTIDKHPDLDKATGRLIDELMYRHWDEWVETIPHPFLVDYDGKKVTNKRDILAGEPYECP